MKSVHLSSLAAAVLGLAVVATPMAAVAKTITVRPGESIQVAVDGAHAGDTIKVLSGEYVEPFLDANKLEEDGRYAAVRITKSLKLMASGHVRLLPAPGQTDGIVAAPNPGDPDIHGLQIVGFTVEGFSNNGIWLAHVDGFNIENNVSIDNLENGIWPTLSANGQVKKNVAYGSIDSALWVEASENIRIINNDLHHSPTGLEVTISKNLTIEDNEIHHNTVGIGLYHPAAAGLDSPYPASELGNWHIANNYVHDNNEPNAAEGGEVELIPPGLGMLILGVDRVDVQKNRFENNKFVGVGMIDWCVAVDCGRFGPPEGFEDTAVDSVQIEGNKFAGNHNIPLEEIPPELPVYIFTPSDILYIGADLFGGYPGVGNCVSDNKLIKTPDPKDPGILITAWLPDALGVCH